MVFMAPDQSQEDHSYIQIQIELVQVVKWMWENNIKSCQTDRPTSLNKKQLEIGCNYP